MKKFNPYIQSIFLVVFSVFIFTSTSSCSDTKSIHLDEIKLKGNVKSIKETSYEAIQKDGKIVPGKRAKPSWKKDTYRGFNRKGEIIEELIYNTDGSLRSICTLKTLNKNSVAASIFKPSGELKFRQITNYNDQGKLVEKVRFNLDGETLVRNLYLYNENGNRIEDLQYLNSQENPSIKTTYKYDMHGNKVEEYMYNPEGRLIAKWLSKYDEQNSLVEENYYYADGNLSAQEVYSYEFDKKGNWIQQIVVSNDVPKYIVIREIRYY